MFGKLRSVCPNAMEKAALYPKHMFYWLLGKEIQELDDDEMSSFTLKLLVCLQDPSVKKCHAVYICRK